MAKPRSDLPMDRIPMRNVLRIVAVLIGVVLLFLTFFQIEPEEVGVVLRFGKYVRTASPGLNLRVPIVERVYKVPIQRQLKDEFGFRTVRAGVRTQYARGSFLEESLMLTGDLNTVVVEWIVQYKVKDPVQYLFKVRSVRDTFRDLSEAVMREVVGDHSVNEVLTVRRQEIEDQAKLALQDLCDQYEMGIDVQVAVMQDVNPPDPVKPSFNEVNQAIQEKETLINEAWSEYNQEIPRAEGEAKRTIEAAEGYAIQRVNNANGDAARFVALYDEYRKAPEVTRRRLYLETMSKVLPRVGRKLVVDESQTGVLPLLNLQTGGEKP
ncbi:MAG: FtsH protease activity modulator HflK [Candidatus Latescibacterota bacterium]|nr:MAG: FtsH protease activity modulator HflK [Candidatus Latescibacterota bacterium]